MKSLLLACPLLLLLTEGEESAAPAAYAALLEQVAAAQADGDPEAALATLGPLLDGSFELVEWQRAEVQYAHGVLLAALHLAPPDPSSPPPDILAAAQPFDSARALAGPSALRLDATYNLGGVFLLEGERLRVTLPEIAGQTGAPPASMPVPGLPGPKGGSEDPASDPLERARSAYNTAKQHLIERLRADWRDADTRANLELIQRRLDELERIEKEREQQEQEQEQEDGEGEEGGGEEGEEQEEGEEGEDEESSEDEQSDSDSEGDPDQKEPQGGPPQEQETQETQPPDEGGEAQDGDPGQPQERLLTREEVMRLLDRLSQLEEEREELEAALRESQRVPVPRDW